MKYRIVKRYGMYFPERLMWGFIWTDVHNTGWKGDTWCSGRLSPESAEEDCIRHAVEFGVSGQTVVKEFEIP